MGDKQGKAKTIIYGDAVFCPEKGLKRGAALLVRDGNIVDIADRHELIAANPTANTIERPGYIISPPFCDHHLHIFENDLENLAAISDILRHNGIAAIFEAGSKNLSGLQAKGLTGGALKVKTSGHALFKKGTYGSYLGQGIACASEAFTLIDKLQVLGVDFIKIINSGIIDLATGRLTPGGFSANELSEIIGYTKAKGLPVHCHANGEDAVRACSEAGADAIVHGFFTSAETLAEMAERATAFIPTIAALKRLTHIGDDPRSKNEIDKYLEMHLSTVNRAFELGVRILPGSDSGPGFIPYGISYLEELDLLRHAGLTVEELLSGAVSGSLRPGERADFVLLPTSSSAAYTDRIRLERQQPGLRFQP